MVNIRLINYQDGTVEILIQHSSEIENFQVQGIAFAGQGLTLTHPNYNEIPYTPEFQTWKAEVPFVLSDTRVYNNVTYYSLGIMGISIDTMTSSGGILLSDSSIILADGTWDWPSGTLVYDQTQTIQQIYANAFNETPNAGYICIMEGQDVLLDKGYTKIEDIQPGDTINGSQVYKVFKQPAGECLVKFPKDCFGLNVPDSDVYVTHNHMVIDPSTGKLNNAVVYTLLNKNVKMVEPPKEFVYNILMKEWGVVTVNNMKCESLCPFSPQGMNELIAQGVHDESFKEFVQNLRGMSIDDLTVQGNHIFIQNVNTIENYYYTPSRIQCINELKCSVDA